MFKHRGRYHLYYETYHAIRDVTRPYKFYDDLEAADRASQVSGRFL